MYYKIEHNKFLIYTSINNNKRMFRNIKTAWCERDSSADVKNAYNHIKENDAVVNLQGKIIGIATSYRGRCTGTSPGSVNLLSAKKENIWISGDVIDIGENTWVVTNNTKIKLNT